MRTLLCGLALAASVGCVNVQPVGPLAQAMGKNPNPPAKRAAQPKAEPADVTPVTVEAQRPAPPAMLVTPGEVSADSHRQAIEQLTRECEQDRSTMPPPPRTAEISRVRGGVQ